MLTANAIMKTKRKIGATLLKIICLGLGVLIGIFCILFWFFTVRDFSGISLVMTLCFSVFSVISISLGSGMLKTIRIDETTKIISKTTLKVLKKEWRSSEITGYKIEAYVTKYGDFERILIGAEDGDQIHIFSFGTKNYAEVKDVITSIYRINSELKFNQLWPTILKTSFVFYSILILTAVISVLTV
jgi:hypothetical protein